MAKKNTALESLDFLANHFAPRDWDYTRVTNLKRIQYNKGFDKKNELPYRIKLALKWFFSPTPEWLKRMEGKPQSLASRWNMAMYCLSYDTNLPDGILDSGNIITFWEETGEYLNLMQPTVGSLLVDFLKEEPEHPHAVKILQELNRLQRRYDKRIKAGEVSGKPE